MQTGGPSGGCLPEDAARHAGRLRQPDRGRIDDGIGRHDRHGRSDLHGRRGPLLHRLPHRGIMRQVRPVPRRVAHLAGHPDPDHAGQGQAGRHRPAPRDRRGHAGLLPVRAGHVGPQSGPVHDPILQGGVRRAHQGPRLPGGRLQGADRVYRSIRRNATGATPASRGCSTQGHHGRGQERTSSTRASASSAEPASKCASATRSDKVQESQHEDHQSSKSTVSRPRPRTERRSLAIARSSASRFPRFAITRSSNLTASAASARSRCGPARGSAW